MTLAQALNEIVKLRGEKSQLKADNLMLLGRLEQCRADRKKLVEIVKRLREMAHWPPSEGEA